MFQPTIAVDTFKQRLRELLTNEVNSSNELIVQQHTPVYVSGDNDGMVYFIESGQVKLTMNSSDGRECIIAILTSGDLFGESSLPSTELESGLRRETVIAMVKTTLKTLPSEKFISILNENLLLNGFVQYLAMRISEQQQIIVNLVTIDSEKRLGKILLNLARKFGKQDPHSILINLQITHEELSNMVGTTRPRISFFMKRFKNLGLIEITKAHMIVIKEKELIQYIDN